MSKNKALELEKIKIKSEIEHPDKKPAVAYAFWALGGWFGLHRFYLGKQSSGIAFVLLTLSGIFTFGFAFTITLLWWMVDAFLTYKYVEEHNKESKLKRLEILENYEKNLPDNVNSDNITSEVVQEFSFSGESKKNNEQLIIEKQINVKETK